MNTHENGTPCVGSPNSLARLHSELVDRAVGHERRVKTLCETIPKAELGSSLQSKMVDELSSLTFELRFIVKRILELEHELWGKK